MRHLLAFTVTAVVALGGAASVTSPVGEQPVWGGEFRFAIHAEPKTWDPLMVADDSSLAIRILTHAALVRMISGFAGNGFHRETARDNHAGG